MTSKFYLRNVHQFLQYFKETKPKLRRLSQTQIVGAIHITQKALKDLRKKITLHQVAVKRTKMAKIVSVDSLRRCHEAAKAKAMFPHELLSVSRH